ncbi:MAG: hypothetical protein IJA73_00495 [Oscillospiraceae bacterium]|nr:hypothetical protein [Oscillospiraceae bacterium]
MKRKKDRRFPYDPTPTAHPHFGQPEDCCDLVSKYGTYNVQSTCESENLFPLIAHALPSQWKNIAIGKDEIEKME